MKKTHFFLASIFIMISFNTISAQFNGNGGNGGFNRGGGMNQMGGGMNQGSQPEKPKEVPVEETAALLMEQMKPALNLDELQTIAISNVLKETLRTQGILLKQNFSNEEQMKNFEALSETTDRKINQFLSPEQKEKYLQYKEDIKTHKKSKDKSKGKAKSKSKENQE